MGVYKCQPIGEPLKNVHTDRTRIFYRACERKQEGSISNEYQLAL